MHSTARFQDALCTTSSNYANVKTNMRVKSPFQCIVVTNIKFQSLASMLHFPFALNEEISFSGRLDLCKIRTLPETAVTGETQL